MKEKEKLIARRVSGFTLIEILVVLAIIGVLSALIVPSISGYMERAYNAADTQNARTICVALQNEVATDTIDIYKLTKNPWKSGVREDGTAYEADDHGYVYVDKNEIRVSSYAIAKVLEEHGWLKSAGQPTKGEIAEYKYPKSQCSGIICKSTVNWYRYQVNICERDGCLYFTYSANGRTTEVKNYTSMSSGNNKIDPVASQKFADMIGGEADLKTSLG